MYDNFINKDLDKTPGVYIIQNKTDTKRVYVGTTHNMLQRYKQHRVLLESGEHHNKLLNRDYKNGHLLEMKLIQNFNEQPPLYDRRINEELYILYYVMNGYKVYNYGGLSGIEYDQQIEILKNRVLNKMLLQAGISLNCFMAKKDG